MFSEGRDSLTPLEFWKPVSGEKLLGNSVGRGFEALKGDVPQVQPKIVGKLVRLGRECSFIGLALSVYSKLVCGL